MGTFEDITSVLNTDSDTKCVKYGVPQGSVLNTDSDTKCFNYGEPKGSVLGHVYYYYIPNHMDHPWTGF